MNNMYTSLCYKLFKSRSKFKPFFFIYITIVKYVNLELEIANYRWNRADALQGIGRENSKMPSLRFDLPILGTNSTIYIDISFF